MIKLTPLQASIMTVIDANPGISFKEIVSQSSITINCGSGTIRGLIKKKMIIREGTTHKFKHYSVGIAYEVIKKAEPIATDVMQSKVDPELLKAASFQLTDDQRLYLDNHRHLSRSELARKLGIPKLELNFVMDPKRK